MSAPGGRAARIDAETFPLRPWIFIRGAGDEVSAARGTA